MYKRQVFAYAMSLVVYQFGMLFTGNGNVIGVIFAAAIVAFILYMLFKPYKESSRFTAKVKIRA